MSAQGYRLTAHELERLVQRYGNAMGLGEVARAKTLFATFRAAVSRGVDPLAEPVPFPPPPGRGRKRPPTRACQDNTAHAPHAWNLKRGTVRFWCEGLNERRPAQGPVASAFLTPARELNHHDLLDCLRAFASDEPCDLRGARWLLVTLNAAKEELGRESVCFKHGQTAEAMINKCI